MPTFGLNPVFGHLCTCHRTTILTRAAHRCQIYDVWLWKYGPCTILWAPMKIIHRYGRWPTKMMTHSRKRPLSADTLSFNLKLQSSMYILHGSTNIILSLFSTHWMIYRHLSQVCLSIPPFVVLSYTSCTLCRKSFSSSSVLWNFPCPRWFSSKFEHICKSALT